MCCFVWKTKKPTEFVIVAFSVRWLQSYDLTVLNRYPFAMLELQCGHLLRAIWKLNGYWSFVWSRFCESSENSERAVRLVEHFRWETFESAFCWLLLGRLDWRWRWTKARFKHLLNIQFEHFSCYSHGNFMHELRLDVRCERMWGKRCVDSVTLIVFMTRQRI